MNSKVAFDRWSHVQYHTWPFQMYKQYNEELSNLVWSDFFAHKYTYKQLGQQAVNWETPMRSFGLFPEHVWNFETLKDWSVALNEQQNFLHLSSVMAMNSNFEAFLEAIISLSIESNPGLLLGASRSIDGVSLLKNGTFNRLVYKDKVEQCTRGMWGKRKKMIKSIFGCYPKELDRYESDLEQIRILRNRVGHAFGKDIALVRNFDRLEKLPSERVSLERLRKWLGIMYDVAMSMDSFLLDHSIGEYHVILAYHRNKHRWDSKNLGVQVKSLKKFYGGLDQQIGKVFCKGLIEYYKNL